MATVVRTERLTKDFLTGFWRRLPHRALDALSFDIASGEVFGLLGPNGAGKSTTLKILIGLLWPTAGRAELLGRPAGDLEARRRLGFLPEHPTFYDHLTAEELLAYFAGLFGYTGEARRRRASEVLDLVGLGADRRRLMRQFSKGMAQRVGLAQALVGDPELVILDEPMSGLDPLGRRDVRILSDAELLCSRVGILAHGRLVASGTLGELTAALSARSGRHDRGWEIVVSNLAASVADRIGLRLGGLVRIAEGRYSFELAGDARPEPLIAELSSAGAELVSLTPLRTTLEDVFVEHVGGDAGPPSGAQGSSR